MFRKVALALLLTLPLSGCIQVASVPELYARSQWTGRPAVDAVRQFGTPTSMTPTDDGQVLMQWYHDTSYTDYEVVGYSSEQQGPVIVNTTHWDYVDHPNRCIISVTVDRDKRITAFDVDAGDTLLSNGCAAMSYSPR